MSQYFLLQFKKNTLYVSMVTYYGSVSHLWNSFLTYLWFLFQAWMYMEKPSESVQCAGNINLLSTWLFEPCRPCLWPMQWWYPETLRYLETLRCNSISIIWITPGLGLPWKPGTLVTEKWGLSSLPSQHCSPWDAPNFSPWPCLSWAILFYKYF